MITTSNFSICYCELKQRSEMFRSAQHHKQHGVWCHSERSEESLIISSVSQGRSWNFGCCSQSSLRSNHRGFICSISAIFCCAASLSVLLARDSVVHVAKALKPNEPVQMIAF